MCVYEIWDWLCHNVKTLRSSRDGIQGIGGLLGNVMWVCAIQLCEPPAQLVELGHHLCHIVSFGVHVVDDASHPEGEIVTIHMDDHSAQPVVLTGDDATLCY